MFGWIVLALAIGIAVAAVWIRVWRRWIDPWREVEELVEAIVSSKKPRKFLMTSNARANALGLALETLAERLRETERIAQEGTRNLDAILSALPDGLAIVDRERRLQLTNAQFRRTFGLGERFAGLSLLEATRDGAVDAATMRALSQNEIERETMKIARGVESTLQIEASVVPFAGEAGGQTGAIIVFRDITQMQQVEAMRRDFVANVSHELRTPLSIFRGYLETLLDDPMQPPDELVRILEVMERHAERLTALVEDILSLAQLETPTAQLELTEIQLPDFLGGILRDWERRLGAKLLQASLEAAADLPVIRADEHRLQEVIYNLLDNAVKYSQPEGKITLIAQRTGANVRIAVADEGVGISSRDLPRVFERFYRADKARSRQVGGTGLGLSIVKHIAQLHGGTVEATSEVGRGSVIGILLPIHRTGELESAPASDPEEDVAPATAVTSHNRHT